MGLEGADAAGFMLIICGFLLFCLVVSLPIWLGVWRILRWVFWPYGSKKDVKYSPSSTSSRDHNKHTACPTPPDPWEESRRHAEYEAIISEADEDWAPPRRSFIGKILFGLEDD